MTIKKSTFIVLDIGRSALWTKSMTASSCFVDVSVNFSFDRT